MIDFLITIPSSTFAVVRPMTDEGRTWLDQNTDPDAQRWGRGIVCELSYLDDLVEGFTTDGLTSG